LIEFTKIGPFTFVGDKLLAESFKLTLKEFRIAFYPCRLRGFKVGEDVQLYMLLKLCNTLLGEIENNKKSVRLLPLKSVDQENIYLILIHLERLSYLYLGNRLTINNRSILYNKFKDICCESTDSSSSFVIRKMVVKTESLMLETRDLNVKVSQGNLHLSKPNIARY